ncbi:MAG: HK97-gp10 family putative phage morphogenesis protein [Nitrobacter sp.]
MASDDDVQRYLKDLPFKVKRRLAQKIATEADRLANAIKAAAPVRTGALRDSVKVRRRKNDTDLEVVAGGSTTVHGKAGPHGVADYSLFVEYGTQEHPAQPFFYNTARAMQGEIRENIEDAVQEAFND